MITRRSLDGALKCALRDFLREDATAIVEVWSANVFQVDARRNTPW
jgi:hypothetical protein